MNIIGPVVGYYHGTITRRRISTGVYEFTGPLGVVRASRATEAVFVRSWAKSRTVRRTVWNVLPWCAQTRGIPVHKAWSFTLAGVADNLVEYLCPLRLNR